MNTGYAFPFAVMINNNTRVRTLTHFDMNTTTSECQLGLECLMFIGYAIPWQLSVLIAYVYPDAFYETLWLLLAHWSNSKVPCFFESHADLTASIADEDTSSLICPIKLSLSTVSSCSHSFLLLFFRIFAPSELVGSVKKQRFCIFLIAKKHFKAELSQT